MIIVDFQQVMISNMMAQIGNHTNTDIEESLFRHMVLNAIRSFRQKFFDEYGELVIACDNTNIWRKKIFPYYKANRKKARESSELNWNNIFQIISKIRQELKDNFPYRVIDLESAEADDIISTLIRNFSSKEKMLIVSGDKDFIQLQRYDNVDQYDPVRKKWIKHVDPSLFLREHILKGDVGDGVPNVLSSDNCFVIGERQKPLTQKRIHTILSTDVESLDEVTKRNYYRNMQLIDLSYTPSNIQQEILLQYEAQSDLRRDKLMNYFISNKLSNLLEHIQEY